MDYKKKLRIRLFTAIGYCVTGVLLVGVNLFLQEKNDYFSAFGVALLCVGALQIIKYCRITKNEDTVFRQQIAETDERNIAIAHRAKSMAFMIYVMTACIGVIVLQLLGKKTLATLLGWSVCALLLLYYVSYYFISKRS